MLGYAPEVLAAGLGQDWNTDKLTLIESEAVIAEPVLQQISAILNVPVAAFQNFIEEQNMTIISNTFNEGSIAYARAEHIQCTYDPADKIIELYERMLKEKEEVIKRLEAMIKGDSL